MAGRRRGGRLRRARPPLPPPPEEPSPLGSTTLREGAIAEKPAKKTCHASSSTPSSACCPDVWADLLDSLLLQIIALLISFHDLLAFIGTCHSWRTVFSSHPPAFTFNIPPLHLQPDEDYSHSNRHYVKRSLLSDTKWQLVDPAKKTSSFHCSAPQNLRVHMRYLGCSYGYLIFSNLEQCLLVDVYSGAVVRPPKLKLTGNRRVYYGILVAPINSSNSHLLFCSRSSMFQWKVGSNSWLEHPLPLDGERINQIIFFKGQMFAMDSFERLHRIHLAPQFSMHEVAVVWGEDMAVGLTYEPWLVVCDDMLLLVDFSVSIDAFSGLLGTFKVFRLDLSVEPAKWVKVDNLGDHSLFVNIDRRNQTFSCVSPERWGGKNNSIYCSSTLADSNESWSVAEVGEVVPSTYATYPPDFRVEIPQSLWVIPSFVYGIGR